jgi:outer membrane receptor for ferrienterochelin and colicins
MFARVFVFSLVLASSSLASAQQSSGALGATAAPDGAARKLTGIVRDGTGAVVPAATVIVRHSSSSFERLVDTGRDGRFVVSPVDAGDYRIEVVAPGFAVASANARVPSQTELAVELLPAPVVEAVQIVSASRQQELRESLNTNVNVLSRRQIEESGAQTVAEMLREVPGVMSRRGSETAGAAGEQIQGIDSRQVLVLLDGQPIPGGRGIKRGVINLDRQSLNRLEQIEVVKGASSALYGSDAIGGVINIITRDATAAFDTTGELSGGSFGEVNAVAGIGFRRDRFSGLFSAEHHQNDGFDLTPSTFDTTGAPFERVDFLARGRVRASSALSMNVLVTGYDNRTEGRSNGELGPQEDRIEESTLNVNLQGDWLPRASTSVQARAYVSRFDENSAATLAPPQSTVLAPGALDERLVKIDASFSQFIGANQQLQGGAEYWRDEYSGINRLRNDAGERASISTAWAQHRLTFGSRVTTTLGVRTDHHSQFGNAVSPKAAVNARLGGGVSARASYGRGFRAPDIGQLYYRFLNPSNIYQVIGNLNLQPEYANSVQIGAEYATPDRRARFGVNVFRNDVRDLIESVNLGFAATPGQVLQILQREGLDTSFRPVAGRLLLTYKNVNDARTQGVELDGEFAATPSLSFAGAYTYLDAKDDVTDLRLTGRNTHHGSVRATWRHQPSGFSANVRGLFFGEWIAARATVNGRPSDTFAPGYAVFDAYASQRLLRGLNVFAALDNLTDAQDPNLGQLSATGAPLAIYRPDAGRTFRFGVRWNWSR